MKCSLFLLTVLMATSTSFAQYFVPKLSQEHITTSRFAYVITTEGDSITGRITTMFADTDQIKSFTIKNKEGKFKFTADDVVRLVIQPWENIFSDSGPLNIPEILRMTNSEFNKIIVLDWVFFERIQLPTKKEKYALVQLQNPGFDSRLKIYVHSNANETAETKVGSITVAGGDAASHLLVVDGGKAQVVRKRKYQEMAFSEIFVDCDAMKENYQTEKLKWKDFAKHVFMYDQCQ